MSELSVGTLSDKDIKEFCQNGKLITEEFNERNVKQACYELRASNIYYDITVSDRKIEVADDSYILIKPKQLVVIMTLEGLEMPPNILGRILTKGKLFSIGLLPVNTYADPGFSGNLGIVFSNLSNNYLKIKPRESIAKIEFSKLEKNVERSYSGQHGFQTGVWPVPREMILTEEEVRNDPRIKNIPEEIVLSHGSNVGKVIDRIYKYERKFVIATIGYFTFTLVLIAALQGTNWITPVSSILLGVFSNVLYTFVTWAATNFRR
ncbi:hypothetical protein U5N28_17040 [Lysinibacillus telephonicus]|uniref:Uncharacterized protein n=1 Tax=Lysinibacillus telephonicus TaxID=1714840 RepID=A0A3S0JZP7_9BACI|nr:hypothetical protein [Lysinibacillus telephonicus]RTQ96492.1 hypothetical protein EKG35_00130 [Lysinibacillus telephonicus]